MAATSQPPTNEDDAGLQLVCQCEHGADELVAVAQPLADQRAGGHVEEEALRLVRQGLGRSSGSGVRPTQLQMNSLVQLLLQAGT